MSTLSLPHDVECRPVHTHMTSWPSVRSCSFSSIAIQLFESIYIYSTDLNKFLEDLEDGVFIQLTLDVR